MKKVCQKCGKRFKYRQGELCMLCNKCIKTLPRCAACGIIIAPQYGYLTSSTQVGKYNLCDSCYLRLKRKGRIKLEGKRYLLPGGEVVQREKELEGSIKGENGG
jgi:hypothetical protein